MRLLPAADFRVDLTLDRLKQKEATKRALFLHSQTFHYSKNMTVNNNRQLICEEQEVFLRVRNNYFLGQNPQTFWL